MAKVEIIKPIIYILSSILFSVAIIWAVETYSKKISRSVAYTIISIVAWCLWTPVQILGMYIDSIFDNEFILLVPSQLLLIGLIIGIVALVIIVTSGECLKASGLKKIFALFVAGGMSIILVVSSFPMLDNWERAYFLKRMDTRKLLCLSQALYSYKHEYDELPSEVNFKNQLLSKSLILNENLFYSGRTNIPIRYFRDGNDFVFVTPGKNRKYDTPEGYENIKAFKKKTDDMIEFGKLK